MFFYQFSRLFENHMFGIVIFGSIFELVSFFIATCIDRKMTA